MEDLKQLNEDINALIEEYLESQQVDYEKIDYKDLAYNLKYNHCLNGKLEILMEKSLGRFLNDGEIVHHKDENTLNNDISNLQLMTATEHIKHHIIEKKRKQNGQFTI